jgi:periplasmic glucans biosynthesis protein
MRRMTMRAGKLLGLGVAALCLAATAGAQTNAQLSTPVRGTEPFDRDALLARAAELAKRPYEDPIRHNAPELKLNYDQYRSIRFRNEAAIWSGENRTFTVDLFYPGFIFNVPVNINLVVAKMARRVVFTNDLFESDANALVANGPDAAYSGFRVRAPLNRPDFMDEFLVFQGASYFRAVARGQQYGLSARGLAVRTARAEGEEFPAWTDFWIERPVEKAERIVIHAILQSRSVVGAYTFAARPGNDTIIDVDATLFARTELTAFGVAPLTSMFLFDSSNRARFDDYRSAVHDSDGLRIINGRGERVWRPLANPASLQISAFIDDSPKGFGLIQRKRNFEDFEDAEALYNKRPSLWVEPKGQWGRGHVELVEIPSDREIHDNIVAYWQPKAPIAAGQKANFSYRLRFTGEPIDPTLARVVATRSGASLQNQDQRSFVVDYRGGGPVPADLKPEVWSSAGVVLNARAHPIQGTDIYRASFELDPGREDIIELRLVLMSNGKPWGETWLYRWSQ